ncbi:anthranilate synthase component I family protein [Micrococcus sp. KRD026]|uniref:anthranilate synthase component I family protein n=1 Tax=Micrococcus sp. KRD026 TaxID=2729718 RepID=UPI0019D148EE|nr:anthranilate synthase component I family protein [Micrococcus sp. KRD026]
MPTAPAPSVAAATPLHVAVRTLDAAALAAAGHTAATAVAAVYAHAVVRGAASFWLDSALPDPAEARWSVAGDGLDVLGEEQGRTPSPGPRLVRHDDPADPDRAWADLAAAAAPRPVVGGEGLPLRGGLVGWLGYELGLADLGVTPPSPRPGDPASLPAQFWVRPSRYVVADHAAGVLHCCVVSLAPTAAETGADRWAADVRRALAAARRALETASGDVVVPPPRDAGPGPQADEEAPGTWREDRAAYAEQIARCRAALHAGDSYELCLTTRFDADPGLRVDPLVLFHELAAHQPAPYAALLEHGTGARRWAVVSASPERFLAGRAGRYSTKPIKGTAARLADPVADAEAARALAADPKTRAENLMIVDLLRNDLSRVCEPGSVEVPSLMAVESYASVHQLVSTVTGTARAGVEPVDVVRSLFPGGSMTGAPKRRSVELLAAWEASPRGVYSGALGMLSADGTTSLSVVIRTAVLAGGRWSVGAGGAIVADSDPAAEHDEVLLKARGLRRALARAAGTGLPTTSPDLT